MNRIDEARERALMAAYRRGLNDHEIGALFGIGRKNVWNWRKSRKLPTNYTLNQPKIDAPTKKERYAPEEPDGKAAKRVRPAPARLGNGERTKAQVNEDVKWCQGKRGNVRCAYWNKYYCAYCETTGKSRIKNGIKNGKDCPAYCAVR